VTRHIAVVPGSPTFEVDQFPGRGNPVTLSNINAFRMVTLFGTIHW
jgi:hypothetical protein